MIENEEFESIREFIKLDRKSLEKIQETLIDDSYFSYKVYIRLQPTCLLKRVRLFIIFRALSELGQICFTNPDLQVLESGEFKLDFEIYFISQKEDNEILKALDEILEIENKYILSKSKDEFITLFSEFVSSGTIKDKIGIEPEIGAGKSGKQQQEQALNNEIVQAGGLSNISQNKGKTSNDLFSNITDLQKDALKEIGNIGAGNAANALAGLISRRVDINIPSVQIIELDQYINNLTKNKYTLFTTWSNIIGDNKATILILFKISDVIKLVSVMIEGMEDSKAELSEADIKSIDDLPELYTSALSELGHILANHYSIALGNLLELKLMTEPPGMSLDIGEQLHDTINNQIGLYNGLSLLIATTIMIKDLMVSGSCIFIPDPATMDRMLDALSQFL